MTDEEARLWGWRDGWAPIIADWLAREKGELGFKVLGAVAAALDPSGVMAPGAGRALRGDG
jgi:hypothetical protein